MIGTVCGAWLQELKSAEKSRRDRFTVQRGLNSKKDKLKIKAGWKKKNDTSLQGQSNSAQFELFGRLRETVAPGKPPYTGR